MLPAIIGNKPKGLKVIRSSGDIVSALTNLDPEDVTIQAKTYNPITEHGTSILGSFYTNSRSYKEFIELSLLDTMDFVNVIWKELYDEYLFLERTLEANI